SIAFWLMGGLTYVTMDSLLFLIVPVFLSTAVLLLLRWRINILSFGDEEAGAMGVDPRKMRAVVIVCATAATASAVAVGGMIGWVGLVVPHLARMLVGADQKHLLPCSAVMGALFMLAVDDAARCLFAQDLPISILTALVGGPVFVTLLYSGRRSFL
ncbi:MAG: iron ABC transporter permease, partial [Oscillospiraceae bacterium]|nr:iron ABC transporter permease [Oscillospiraceae bacterium]